MSAPDTRGIAVIGLVGRFPGAANIEQYWRNIADGVESISMFSDEELASSGLDVAELKSVPGFVPARGVLSHADLFDAGFFGMSATEASVTDPQQRLFLEASWELLESAGYDPETFDGLIGVYAGMGGMGYYLNYLHGRRDISRLVGERIISLGNDKDYLAPRVAYKLNLKGPAININTACSTSLVTVCQACQELISFQCDMALAGGISITFPQKSGVYYQEGGVFSPDGHCRPFDAQAQGTVSSDGLGIVLLKRLSDALEDGDQIHAVIRGFGRNNDGSAKVGFTAPSVDGQAEAIMTAQTMAHFDPARITYVEAHGTGTPLGDPIEIAALTQAFRLGTEERNFCAIGSVKGNIGHTNAAAGAASLLKTIMALRHRQLPPTLHFTAPNPKIDFADSPFFVNTRLSDWKSTGPRRAGVSSFGLGGTNAHVVLEEAPSIEPSAPSSGEQLLLLSAKNPAALDTATTNLLDHLKAHPTLNLADAAYTLQVGRRSFPHRRCLVCRDSGEAIQTLEARDAKRLFTFERDPDAETPGVVFMFPGQGSQYVGMGADLHRDQPVFKEELDRCANILVPSLDGLDLRDILYPPAGKTKEAEELLIQTRITQPALFAIEYALAKLWMSWGIQPAALTGHSLGEYVAACLAGVFSLEDALALVAERGRLIQSLPRGSMLAVSMPETELKKILPPGLSIAGVNGPLQCVVSGPVPDIDAFSATLTAAGKPGRPLHTSHAFHSAMMDPVVPTFAERVRRVKRGEPTIPFVSNVTGEWITPADAVDPQYWARHLRQAVRFADGIRVLLQNKSAVFLEVGPGTTLSALTKFQAAKADNRAVLSSLRHAREEQPDRAVMLTTLGHLWMRGVPVDWPAVHGGIKRRRVTLPGHPLQRQRHWIEPATTAPATPAPRVVPGATPRAEPKPGASADSAGDMEQLVAEIWQQILGLKQIGADENFFDLGGDSLLLMRVQIRVREELNVDLGIAEMFEYPTIGTLARRLGQEATALARSPAAKILAQPASATVAKESDHPSEAQDQPRLSVAEPVRDSARTDSHAIAIVGMSGRFPGANSVDELWRNLVGGVDSTSFFTDEELAASGLNAAELRANRNYVAARGIIDRPEWFDAGFFSLGAKEAQVIDPQQRIFLEHAWEALENAGYDPARYPGHVGVFAGMAGNTYYLNNLQSHPELVEQVGRITIFMGNEKDFLATRTSYKLNLKGPAISVNTACSTSLVAVALACQSLTSQQCEMALAGGVSIRFPQKHGNLYQEGSVFSRDGICRPFDAEASGTFFSDGLGIVVLKRLDDAVRDGDQVYAVIKGIGLNNDGSDKVGYTAPSVQGQAEAISRAHAHAGINPDTISYVEAHGTATALGDPIEIAALTQAFRSGTTRKQFCAIGSIKGNFGHCDSAAGVVGLIKTVLALRHRQLPPSLHFTAPNPRIDFAGSPFFVNSKLTEWQAGPTPRRAGISSFGIGGTNVHLVLEEAPPHESLSSSRSAQLLLFSARNVAALDAMTARFVAHLKANPDLNLADAAYTLQVGRRAFPHRRMLVCRDVADAIQALETLDPKRVVTQQVDAKSRPSDPLPIASFADESNGDSAAMLDRLGRLWLEGKPVDFAAFYARERRQRIALPTYPFQRERYWIERGTTAPAVASTSAPTQDAAVLTTEAQVGRHARPEMESAFAMATSDVEKKLVEIWQDVFGLQEVGVDDSFFDLGGDSLLAVPLITKINSTLGCELQIPVFFQNPTIRKLAPALQETSSVETSPQQSTGLGDEKGPFIITFQTKGSRPPFFFLHGDWAGGGFYCGHILARLGDDQPFYTLPPYRAGRTDVVPFEEMVDNYYRAIRAHTPRGPYIIGGYCIGGMIALEVARRLVEEGDEVQHLFQIDVPWRSSAQAYWTWACFNLAGNLLRWNLLKKIQMYDRYALGLIRFIKMPLGKKILALGRRLKLTNAGSTDPGVLGVSGGASFDVFSGMDYNGYVLSAVLHKVKPIDIPSSLYFAEEGVPMASRERYVRGVVLHATLETIPGNHTTCITRYANVPADKIAQVLDAKFPRNPTQP